MSSPELLPERRKIFGVEVSSVRSCAARLEEIVL
jgi:hypothetical protein